MKKPYDSVFMLFDTDFDSVNSRLNQIIKSWHILYDYTDNDNTYRVLSLYGIPQKHLFAEQVCIHVIKDKHSTQISVHSIPLIGGAFEVRQYRQSGMLEEIVNNFTQTDCDKKYLSDYQIKQNKRNSVKATIVVIGVCIAILILMSIIERLLLFVKFFPN